MVKANLRILAWELTRSCNLKCVHCRASAEDRPHKGELDTGEAFRMIDGICTVGKPVVILSGGEPLLRKDVFDITAYGTKSGLRMVMGTNGTLLADSVVRKLKAAGLRRVSMSLDGSTEVFHDSFRGVKGAFKQVIEAAAVCRKEGLQFQINSTIVKNNVDEMPSLVDLAEKLGAAAHHIFLLVPTGRAKEMHGEEVSAEKYEEILDWFCRRQSRSSIELKATCAPQYQRIVRTASREHIVPEHSHGHDGGRMGCLAGISFCFISHRGILQPCGYLDVDCGDAKKDGFASVWNDSPVFKQLRDLAGYKGKCGKCEYKLLCGGCRARAFAGTGDYLEEEPNCPYVPKTELRRQKTAPGAAGKLSA